MRKILFLALFLICSTVTSSQAQEIDEDQLGAWYMYFVNKQFKNSRFGLQGDYQFRFWNAGSDLEQIILRTGVTYRPENVDILFTTGYANITTGTFGESDERTVENRIYQEALFPQKLGTRFLLTHRFRFEQRWVDNQDFRTRYRYNIFLNIPLNATALEKNTIYIALYNEIFINGQREIGAGRSVQFFDRNRTYLGLGYNLRDNLRVQGGWMKQTTVDWAKGQAQISLHHSW